MLTEVTQTMDKSICTPRHRNKGLTLIEVLVALLVLSIGLAGMAAMHLNSLKNVSSSYYRSLASTIALDFEERLWLESAIAPEVELDADGCPDPDAIAEEVVADWTNSQPSWDWATGERATLPTLGVTAGEATKIVADPGPDPVNPTTWIELPVTVSWAEGRFEGEASDQFLYTVRTLCKQPEPV